MKLEREIIALLSEKALKNFSDFQDTQSEYDEDSPEPLEGWINRLVYVHQCQSPASWQHWVTSERAETMARIADVALRNQEFEIGRVITIYA